MTAKDRLIVALDVKTREEVSSLVGLLSPHVGFFKVGLELMTGVGASQVVRQIHELGGKVFLDGKFNDIPNTVGAAAREAAALGVSMFNVHAAAGLEAMKAAVQNKGKALCLAVTVLTSLDDQAAMQIFGHSVADRVVYFAKQALIAGVDGIVCSPMDLKGLSNEASLKKLIKVTPGVRPLWASPNDQRRHMGPGEAVAAGADYLVIGRPITAPPADIATPVLAAQKIVQEIEQIHHE
ncbi:MAG: orotidine-5'-phosphate decarboxylase [Deltaproteobacteria bacterium]|nr:orotidine-5'-phosphate decarboxylase [Deltaproteobacteria bacterium]